MIHDPAFIHPSVKIGKGTVVWHLATILEGTVIGENCVIGSKAFIGRKCRLGSNIRIQDGAHITNGAIIEDDVFIGPAVVSSDDKYPRVGNSGYTSSPPVIRRGASIGAGAILLPGVTIGENAMIAAGAVVTSNVPRDETVVGVPARLRVVK